MNRKDAKNAKKTFIIVKAKTKTGARRAWGFIDSGFSYRINKNKTLCVLCTLREQSEHAVKGLNRKGAKAAKVKFFYRFSRKQKTL